MKSNDSRPLNFKDVNVNESLNWSATQPPNILLEQLLNYSKFFAEFAMFTRRLKITRCLCNFSYHVSKPFS